MIFQLSVSTFAKKLYTCVCRRLNTPMKTEGKIEGKQLNNAEE